MSGRSWSTALIPITLGLLLILASFLPLGERFSQRQSASGPRAEPVTETPSKGWRISGGKVDFGVAPGRRRPSAIEGYADRASALPGEPVQLFVSTSASEWRATAYRMGWYDGALGARVWRSDWRPGERQANGTTEGKTLTPVARWRPSLALPTTSWRPGNYLIRLETREHARYVPLTVRSPSTRDKLVLLSPSTNWQAYNDWGGRNVYWGPKGKGDYQNRARAVSYDRPYVYGKGASEFLSRMLPVVALAERLGLPLAYVDDVDLEADPDLLAGAHGVISMGHDEYYSVEMRAALESARDAGTNIAFLGANAVYRRIRLEPTDLGPHRLLINYKDPREDPMTKRKPELTTADWPAGPEPNPQSTLTGASYACFPAAGDLVVSDPTHWLLAGTGLAKGDKIPGALGPEFDAVTAWEPTPRPLDVFLRSPVSCGAHSHADTVYYSTSSGAGVFNTGTMGWVASMNGRQGARTEKLTRLITTTLLTEFATGPAGLAHPARGR